MDNERRPILEHPLLGFYINLMNKYGTKIILRFAQPVFENSSLTQSCTHSILAGSEKSFPGGHLMRTFLLSLCGILFYALTVSAQQQPSPLAPFIKENSPILTLMHVRIIDGTGSAPQDEMRIDIANGKITAILPASSTTTTPANAKVLDLKGRTVIPGLVGMHEHLFYPTPQRPISGMAFYGEMADSAPRLYLAGGVTTARTAGSISPYLDIALKQAIDDGKYPGPKLRLTGPYLEGPGAFTEEMHVLTGPDDAARTVDYWASEGITSYKAYMNITPDELKAAIEHAHAHHIKFTGHLCSIGFTEAANDGIDNLEHGIIVDTEFYPKKQPGLCPPNWREAEADLSKNHKISDPDIQAMIHTLVSHNVAITSTLAVFETFSAKRPPMAREARALKSLMPSQAEEYLATRAVIADMAIPDDDLKFEFQFEREFVKAGGLLMAGCDPTGYGGVLPGFGDQRNLELLVEAGFTPVEAIQIATLNGAKFLGEDSSIGSIATGKSADLVVLSANPAEKIENIESVEMVFKDGVSYDPAKLIDSVKGLMGLR
jgi:imidazolonepropionase-like amidohydrolase